MDDNQLEILKLRYQDQVELLRFISSIEIKVIFGYFTVVAAIIAWLITKVPATFSGQIVFSIIIGISTSCIIYYLYTQKKRRDETVKTIVNINEAFGLYEVGKFIEKKAINPPSKYRPLFSVYLVAVMVVGLSAVYLILRT